MGFNESTSTGTIVLMNHSVSGIAMQFGEDVLKAAARW
jgi:hypothetical protein